MTELLWAPDGSDDAVAARVEAAVKDRREARLALPGGSTPAAVYARLTSRSADWSHVDIWPTDDRIVPAGHAASNSGMLRRAFAATGARIHPLGEGASTPHFDLVWLGMGADGHVASLFPNTDPSAAAPAGVIRVTPDPLPAEAPYARLTLTLAALVAADVIILVVRGDAKRELLVAAAAGKNDLPIARLLAAAPISVTAFWAA